MSDHSYTEVTTKSWFSRISSAIAGILFGLIMFVLAFPLLFWNEGRAVDRIKTLEEGSGSVITIQSDQVLPENSDRLVHLSGKANTDEILNDKAFDVSSNALKLRRKVQIFQWQEETSKRTKKKLGGGEETITEYTYTKGWDDDLANSDNFKKTEYKNPSSVPFKEIDLQAQNVSLGAFNMPGSLVGKINNYRDIDVTTRGNLTLEPELIASLYQGGYYIGSDPSNPQVGDLRITFSEVVPSVVSVVAKQTSNTFEKYLTDTGSILLLEQGEVSAQAMFETAKTENTILTWALRFAGLLLMSIGLGLILRPISVLADVVPLFGNIAEVGIGIVSFLVGLVLSIITIAVAWIWFRPLVGGLLLLAALGVAWLIRNRVKSKKLLNELSQANAPDTPKAV